MIFADPQPCPRVKIPKRTLFAIVQIEVPVRGSQGDVVCLGWPIAPSYTSPNTKAWGLQGLSQWVQLCTSRDMEHKKPFGDLSSCLTYGSSRFSNFTVQAGSAVLAARTAGDHRRIARREAATLHQSERWTRGGGGDGPTGEEPWSAQHRRRVCVEKTPSCWIRFFWDIIYYYHLVVMILFVAKLRILSVKYICNVMQASFFPVIYIMEQVNCIPMWLSHPL